MIKKCNTCDRLSVCLKAHQITNVGQCPITIERAREYHRSANGGVFKMVEQCGRHCRDCHYSTTCDVAYNVDTYKKCPICIISGKTFLHMSTNSVSRIERLKNWYERSHYQILSTTWDETGNATLHFQCTSCGYKFDKRADKIKASGMFSCPNRRCKSIRRGNLSEKRIDDISQEFSYRYDVYDSYLNDKNELIHKFRCKVCGFEFEKPDIGLKRGGGTRFGCPNPLCNSKFRSSYEIRIGELLKSLDINYIANTKEVLKRHKELDIYIPDYKLAIEIDGTYWHDDKNNYYKFEECQELGIRLIQITDIELINNPELIFSYIKSQLGIFDEVAYARKCQVKEISNSEYNEFMEKNHLQGTVSAKVRLGLFYNNRLIQVESFSKSRYNKNYEWELMREASLSGYKVIGGKGKLLKYFIRHYEPKSIISYCSKNKFSGISYLKVGFDSLGESRPGYYYVRDNTVYSRVAFQKHKLSKKLVTFDANLTESENMKLNGYHKMYDYGNYIFGMVL